MAETAKKGKKKKGKTLNLVEFLTSDGGSSPSSTGGHGMAFNARSSSSWADESEDLSTDVDIRWSEDSFGGAPKRQMNISALPTAPRASLTVEVDYDKIPNKPPYTAFLGNLPYDVEKSDIMDFFQDVKINDVRLPQDAGGGRPKGFGYAEFEDKESLIAALAMNNETLRGRKLRIDIAGQNQGGGEHERRDRDDGPDPTLEDWRSGRKEATQPRPGDSFGSARGSEGSWGRDDNDRGSRFGDRGRRDFGDDFSRQPRGQNGYNRSDSYGDRGDRGYGDRSDRGYGDRSYGDRGGSRGYGDRGGSRSYGDRGDRSYGDRGDRGYGDRGDRGYGDRDNQGYGDPSDDANWRSSKGSSQNEEFSRERARPPPPIQDHESAKSRPKLQLKPRSKAVEAKAPADSRSSIFGAAKPVDTAAKEREIEEKLHKLEVRSPFQREEQKAETEFKRDGASTNDVYRNRKDSGRSSGGEFRIRRDSGRSSDGEKTSGSRGRRDSEKSLEKEGSAGGKDVSKPAAAAPPPVNVWKQRMEKATHPSTEDNETKSSEESCETMKEKPDADQTVVKSNESNSPARSSGPPTSPTGRGAYNRTSERGGGRDEGDHHGRSTEAAGEGEGKEEKREHREKKPQVPKMCEEQHPVFHKQSKFSLLMDEDDDNDESVES